jgi:predicted permease
MGMTFPGWNLVRSWLARVAGVFAGQRGDRELDEELASHLAYHVDENLRRGMSPDEARRQALFATGGMAFAKEAYRDRRGVPFLHHLGQDFRYARRMMRRDPAFTAVTIVSLALGIGANTAVFSLTDAALLKELPVTRPKELVVLEWTSGAETLARSIDGNWHVDPRTGRTTVTSFSVPAFERMREAAKTVSSLFAFAPIEQLNVVTGGYADIADGQFVTGDYYAGLGVGTLRGRLITLADDRSGSPPVAVITDHYWERRFGRKPSAVGATVNVDGIAVTIVGVTPAEFAGALDVGDSPDISLPMSLEPEIRRGSADLTDGGFWWVRVMGRRQPDIPRARVQSELEPAFQRAALDGARNQTRAGQPVELPKLQIADGSHGLTDGRDALERPIMLLTVVAALVLLIACANAANLLLTRAMARQREITVRLALGASRSRIVRQLLVESALFVAGAEAVGLFVANWGKSFLVAFAPSGTDLELHLDLRVFAAATAIAVLTTVLFALAPALQATRVDVAEGLKTGTRNVRGARSPFSRPLIVAQIALSVVLLVDAGLFVRSLRNLRDVDTGFNPDQLLTFRVDPRLSGYDGNRIAAVYRELLVRLSAIPGVRGVTFARHPQLGGGHRSDAVGIVGGSEAERHNVPIDLVGPDFFATMQLPLIVGRAFTTRDDSRLQRVAIINQTFARRFLAGANPVGARLRDQRGELEIVGVARDAKYYSIRKPIEPVIYVPYLQETPGQASFALRTASDPLSYVPAVRRAAHDVDATLSIFDVGTQQQIAESTLREVRLFANVSAVFGALAIILACIGVYGVMAYATARCTGEIGIRIALGASPASIVWLVMRRAVALVGIGCAIGVPVAIAGARLFAAMLYGLNAADPLSLAVAVLLIAAVAFGAAYLPAWRAKRVSPLVALRAE